MTNEEVEKPEVPPVEEAFAHLLKKYTIKGKGGMEETIAEHISRTGGEHVFEKPELLAERLATWHEYITPVKRKQIMEHWFAERGIQVPEDVVEVAGLKSSDLEKKKAESAKKKAEEEGRVWTISDQGKVRPAKEGELGMTFEEAKAAMHDLYGEEPPVVFNAETGLYVPNHNSKLMATHPLAVQMTVREMNKVVAAGEEADPLEVMMGQIARVDEMREIVGGRKGEPTQTTPLTDLVDALKGLDELRAPKDAPRQESLVDTLKELETLGLIGKSDTAIKEELGTLRESIEQLREHARKAELEAMEERHKAEIEKWRGEVALLQRDVQDLTQGIAGLRNELREGKRSTSEYDIMSQLITSGKEELAGFRTDIKSLLGPGRPLPPAKRVAEEMTTEMARMEEADRLAEDLWFR